MSNQTTLSKIRDPIRILRKIRKNVPGTIIAGGYHRDIYHGKRYDDIDIYVSDFPNEDENLAEDVFDENFWIDQFNLKLGSFLSMDMVERLGAEGGGSGGVEGISAAFEIYKNEMKYNVLIVANDPIEFINKNFDFNLCKVYCDGNKVTFTKEFMSDSENRTLTFSPNKPSRAYFEKSMTSHYPKLRKKYPEFQLMLPETCYDYATKLKIPNVRFFKC